MSRLTVLAWPTIHRTTVGSVLFRGKNDDEEQVSQIDATPYDSYFDDGDVVER